MLKFTGDAVGVYVLAGPDAGQLEYQLDGGQWQKAELFHGFSKSLHYPRTVVLASQLPQGPHVITVRISDQKHEQSKGYAARILSFVVNNQVGLETIKSEPDAEQFPNCPGKY